MNPVLRVRAAMSRLRLGQQLFASFAVVVFLTALVGLVALRSLSRVEGEAEALANKWMTAVGHLATERIAVLEARDMEIKHSRTGDASYHGEYEAKFADARKALDDSHHLYQALVGGDAERDLVKTFDTAWQGYQQAVQRVMKLGRDGQQPDAADISDGAASMAFDEALNALDALTRFNFEGGRLAGAQVRATYVQAQRVLWALLGLALVMALAFASMITRGLMRQLGGEPAVAARIAQAVAAGDLTTPIRLRAGDAGSLMAQLHLMQASLAQAVTAVRQGAEYVACASTEIAQGNHDLSGRTEQQAGALLQTTATMDALAHTVSQNSDSSLQADQLAQGACGVARKGGDVVQQVVATMHGINDSSRRIADIVGVIDSIAFQTNILALNAAVEAARAGEQGRGFAVVASEVRNLAQRSSGAAREIKTLIDASVERVCTGTALVDQAGQTMQEIVAAIQRVTQIVGEISAASVEQRAGVGQVGQAVAQMDSAIQQNAALVEQSAVATESLKAQAHKLVDAVAVFQLADAAH